MSGLLPLALAGIGGGALALALRELLRSSPAAVSYIESAMVAAALAGREGRSASEAERRRLGTLAGAAIAVLALLLAGPGPAVPAAAFGPVLAGQLLARRRRTYRLGFEHQIPSIAAGLADALAAGASLRNALLEIEVTVDAAAAAEFARVRADLELGRSPAAALAALGPRLGSEPAAALIGAILSQQRSGGDLAALLRRHGEAAAARARSLAAARSATAQARLTGGMVAAMPLAAALLVELVNPGFLAGMARDPVALILLLIATGLQLAGYLVIQRIGRARA